jgi:hypothetical protein
MFIIVAVNNIENVGIIQVMQSQTQATYVVFVSLEKERQIGHSQPKATWLKSSR